jgi:hypothetical protein
MVFSNIAVAGGGGISMLETEDIMTYTVLISTILSLFFLFFIAIYHDSKK